VYQSGGGVEHRLKSTELGREKPSKCCVALYTTPSSSTSFSWTA